MRQRFNEISTPVPESLRPGADTINSRRKYSNFHNPMNRRIRNSSAGSWGGARPATAGKVRKNAIRSRTSATVIFAKL